MRIKVIYSMIFLLSLLLGCQKDKVNSINAQDPNDVILKTESGAQLVRLPENSENSLTGDVQERTNEMSPPRYPYDGGQCRIIFGVRDFDPLILHGGSGEPAPNSMIQFQGYSQPNGQGVLLFSGVMLITGNWQEFLIPSGGYVRFRIIPPMMSPPNGPILFKFNTSDYGWNRGGVFSWEGIPYNQWLPVKMGRFAPKDNTSYGEIFEEYLCDPWCTWTMPVYFEFGEPAPAPLVRINYKCFLGSGIPLSGSPRLITDYYLNEGVEQTFNIYPIDTNPGQSYYTNAQNLSPNSNYSMWYNFVGADGYFPQTFTWGLSPDPAVTDTSRCCIRHIH
jgi:hypothetical protein